MVIHDRSYSRWKGDRAAPVTAARVIFEAGIRRGVSTIFRRKLPAIGLILAAFGPFVFFFGAILVAAYVRGNAETYPEFAQVLEGEFKEVLTLTPEWVYSYMFLAQFAFVMVACVLVGAPLVAEDRRANALEMYLSRPVTAPRYLLGKLATIAFFIALITVVPAALLVLVQLSVSWSQPGEALRLLELLVRTIVAAVPWVAVPAITIVTASSLADRARNAAILWLSVVVMLEFVVSNILRGVFNTDGFLLLQIGFNIRQVMNLVLGNDADLVTTVPVWASALVLAGWVVLCLRVLVARVRPVEVVA